MIIRWISEVPSKMVKIFAGEAQSSVSPVTMLSCWSTYGPYGREAGPAEDEPRAPAADLALEHGGLAPGQARCLLQLVLLHWLYERDA
jgi:hypothetical protein